LEKANRILFIPREKIRNIGHPNLFSEIMIKTTGKRETWECFQGISKETYKHFEDQMNEYLKT
jgi:hypothetical protein